VEYIHRLTLNPNLIASAHKTSIWEGVASGLSKVWSRAGGNLSSDGDIIDANGPVDRLDSISEAFSWTNASHSESVRTSMFMINLKDQPDRNFPTWTNGSFKIVSTSARTITADVELYVYLSGDTANINIASRMGWRLLRITLMIRQPLCWRPCQLASKRSFTFDFGFQLLVSIDLIRSVGVYLWQYYTAKKTTLGRGILTHIYMLSWLGEVWKKLYTLELNRCPIHRLFSRCAPCHGRFTGTFALYFHQFTSPESFETGVATLLIWLDRSKIVTASTPHFAHK